MRNVFYYLLAMILCWSFNSCSSDSLQQDVVQSSSLSKIRAKAISDFYGSNTRSHYEFSKVSEKYLSEISAEYERNIDFILENNVYTLFEEKGNNMDIIDALIEYSGSNFDAGLGFSFLCEKYKFNEQDAYSFAYAMEAFDYLIENTPMTRGRSSAGKVANCAIAVAGSIVTTVGAASVATGWGLGLFLVGKAISLYGIATCAA